MGVLIVLLVILSKTGVFGKDEGLKVTAEKVQKRTITEIVNASGKIYPEDEVKVSPDISGVITELNNGNSLRVAGTTTNEIWEIESRSASSFRVSYFAKNSDNVTVKFRVTFTTI